MQPAPDFTQFGFADPTPRFVRVTTGADRAGRGLVDGVVVIPGLPVCRVRVKSDAPGFALGEAAVEATVRQALCHEIVVELPWN